MIKFKDSLNVERGIEFNLSYCGKYINLTLWAARNTNGSTVQITIEAFKELMQTGNSLQKKLEQSKLKEIQIKELES